jgi:hypothetical protein
MGVYNVLEGHELHTAHARTGHCDIYLYRQRINNKYTLILNSNLTRHTQHRIPGDLDFAAAFRLRTSGWRTRWCVWPGSKRPHPVHTIHLRLAPLFFHLAAINKQFGTYRSNHRCSEALIPRTSAVRASGERGHLAKHATSFFSVNTSIQNPKVDQCT